MLQGSLDDFALDEVLGLLSSTSKSGRLRLSGDRGTGSLWLDQGSLTAAEASKIPGKTGIEDVMFEMLRFDQGTFSFMMNDSPSEPCDPEEVGFVVQLAQGRLVEWRSIESVVPSLAHKINLAGDLPAEELTISRSEWKAVLAVSDHATVEPVCDELGLDEVDGSRRIMEMIERGLLSIADPQSETDAAEESDESLADVAESVEAESPAQEPIVRAPVIPQVAAPVLPLPTTPVVSAAPTAPVAEESVAPLVQSDPFASSGSSIEASEASGGSADFGTDDSRPPMPPPPSPAEIQSFSADLDDASPFETGELLDESLVGVEEEGGSVLMRYLRNDS